MITFRSATIIDLPILYEFEQGIVAAERPFDPTLKEGYINYYDLKELIHAKNSEVLVAVSKEEIIGSAYVIIKEAKPYLNYESYAYVGFMFVKPSFRGRGISQLIIEQLQNWAKAKNLSEMRLEVYDENDSAIRAYEKVGFKKLMVEMRIELQDNKDVK